MNAFIPIPEQTATNMVVLFYRIAQIGIKNECKRGIDSLNTDVCTVCLNFQSSITLTGAELKFAML